MSDLTMSGAGDLFITAGGDLLIESDFESAVEQHLKIRLRFFAGEWFRDTREGVPYFRDVLVKNPNLGLITSIFTKVITKTPGVSSVSEIGLDFDEALRSLTISFAAVLDNGQTLVFEEFIV